MKLVHYDNQKSWNEFVASQKLGQFLQSFEWGNWQEILGKKVWRLAILNDSTSTRLTDGQAGSVTEIVAVCQLIQSFVGPKLLNKNYFYLPRGPIFDENLNSASKQEIEKMFFEEIEKLAKQEKAIFWRAEFLDFDFRQIEHSFKSRKSIQPANTWILDLNQSEEEILASMHSKTRYNIRLAEKKGVVVKNAKNKKDVEDFFKTLESTSKRNEFGIYDLEYYQRLFDLFKEETLIDDFTHPDVEVYLAEFEGKIIAGIWVMFFGDTATYLYGGMDKQFSKLMAPHLIQWQAIKDSKERGYAYYDFWGIAPEGADKDHPWYGLTRFKKQFGGFTKDYPGCFDLIFNKKWYNIYNKIKKFI